MNNLKNIDFDDNDILIFTNSYEQHVLENPLLNSKIPIWVEFLKTKKYYRDNGIDEDYYFYKRFGITANDLSLIERLISRVKKGKGLEKKLNTNIGGNFGVQDTTLFSDFREQEEYENNNNFELLDEVQDAMDKYYKKMKKNTARRNWKEDNSNNRPWEAERSGSVANVPNRYYSEDILSERPSIEFDVQQFAKSSMLNMSKTNIIQKFDKINSTLDHNDLLPSTYSMNDPNYRPHMNDPNYKPNMSCSKKVHFSNEIDDSINSNPNSKDVGVARFEQDQNAMAKLWQQQDILQQRTLTRNTAIPNKNAFEHQFSYLDANYNRVEDPRLLGQSSRMDNRSTFNR
jgi:hypothetical protein